jgi:hypothetical protein
VAPSATPTKGAPPPSPSHREGRHSDTTTEVMAPAIPPRSQSWAPVGTESPATQRTRLGTVDRRTSATGACQAVCGVLPPGAGGQSEVVGRAGLRSRREPSRPPAPSRQALGD